MRAVTLWASTTLALSCALRCLPLSGAAFRVAVVLSFALNGVAGTWLNFGGPVLSDAWFPTSERTFATAIGASATYMGSSAGFVVGPLVVGNPSSQSAAQHAFRSLHYAYAFMSAFVCVASWYYYPTRPCHPPSEAAAKKRAAEDEAAEVGSSPTWSDLLVGSTGLLFKASTPDEQSQRRRFWIIAGALALPLGVYQGWLATFHLSCPELSATKAGWLGCAMTLSGCIGSVVTGSLLDRFNGRLKLAICSLLVMSTLSFAFFSAAASGLTDVLEFDDATSVLFLFIFGISGGFFYNTTIPLFFELAMETVYGWGTENSASMMLILVNTLFQIAYIAMPTKIGGTVQWPGWLAVCCLFASSSLLASVPVKYSRLEVDAADAELSSNKAPVGSAFDRSGCM